MDTQESLVILFVLTLIVILTIRFKNNLPKFRLMQKVNFIDDGEFLISGLSSGASDHTDFHRRYQFKNIIFHFMDARYEHATSLMADYISYKYTDESVEKYEIGKKLEYNSKGLYGTNRFNIITAIEYELESDDVNKITCISKYCDKPSKYKYRYDCRESNLKIYKMIREFCESKERQLISILVHSEHGCGKTHFIKNLLSISVEYEFPKLTLDWIKYEFNEPIEESLKSGALMKLFTGYLNDVIQFWREKKGIVIVTRLAENIVMKMLSELKRKELEKKIIFIYEVPEHSNEIENIKIYFNLINEVKRSNDDEIKKVLTQYFGNDARIESLNCTKKYPICEIVNKCILLNDIEKVINFLE